ncbi:glycosyltransferase family 4 protein [Roseibium denhamense]|uniref:Glycosyltransferase involved in cell wall bisynthesis n=1 Tax=Roseibium denhamense TaxID=76305 RepID=A0ABY1P4G0_9HYPH|nr:glycosyltransferase [Roseibium denhamense]MTI04199.1 glycosyltransferase family 4 protein [Roseibium denhamense]SMP25510.1 Glycosyltransferase involved in cell wall bisynthesis [Roseibium denhamense]
MNILMMTNTYLPHIGGVARSVSTLARGLIQEGHQVLIIAPETYEGKTPSSCPNDPAVIRVPALKRTVGSGFSVPVRIPRSVAEAIDEFQPDIIHAHQPFLLGVEALRFAAKRGVPTVFTFHTRYDFYGQYVSLGAPGLRRVIVSLARGYCNLCQEVIAPSASARTHLREAGVKVPITVVPTGIDLEQYRQGCGDRGRRRWHISKDAFVAGHVGRLAAEKNIGYLIEGLCRFLTERQDARALIVGDGPMRPAMEDAFRLAGLADRVCFTGFLLGQDLATAYASMDVFAFASRSETQGLVLVEAMAAGVPVVALEAAGTRETVRSGENGTLLAPSASPEAFGRELQTYQAMSGECRSAMGDAARKTAAAFSSDTMVRQTISLYEGVCASALQRPKKSAAQFTVSQRLAFNIEITATVLSCIAKALMPGRKREQPGRPSGILVGSTPHQIDEREDAEPRFDPRH